ncbi:F-box protein SKIP23 isoform X2 [Argentina anserina]|nr:F-box protein SKIP23 isoform X2 [Potentilla anserina]
MMADWSLLPKELLEEIAKRLGSPFYLLRIRSVCSSWRSYIPPRPRRLPGRFPFLTNYGISDSTLGFHLSKRTVFLIALPSSPHRWLVKIEEDVPGRTHLLNPLSRFAPRRLPESFPKVLDLSRFRILDLAEEFVLHHVNFRPLVNAAANLYMEKVVFMCLGDESSDYVLLTIHVSGELALFKSVDKKWSIIHDMPSPYDDVILFRGEFYAVDGAGRTVRVALEEMSPILAANPVYGGDKKFLVESSGELLVVDMYLSTDQELDWEEEEEEVSQVQLDGCIYERTVKFKVYKVDEGGQKLVQMKSLGDRVLFLGDDCTFSAAASELSGCRGNCIYFTDNFFHTSGEEEGTFKGREIGVFDLDSGAITPLSDYPESMKLLWPPPEWVSRTASQ